MLESYRLDPSQRIYTMVLRPNLRFHDGSPVRAIDVVASLRRWALRDNAGVWLSRFGMQIAAVDERTCTIETPSPTPMVLLALSAPSDPPFIMRERDAMNPAENAVTEIVGSDREVVEAVVGCDRRNQTSHKRCKVEDTDNRLTFGAVE
jgi:peptide/nickel transport system substrate-binding protein